MQIELPQSSKTTNAYIVGLDWYSGYQESGNSVNPCLAICYDNGHLLLMKSATDLGMIFIYTCNGLKSNFKFLIRSSSS